jgi:hypothetical protein
MPLVAEAWHYFRIADHTAIMGLSHLVGIELAIVIRRQANFANEYWADAKADTNPCCRLPEPGRVVEMFPTC